MDELETLARNEWRRRLGPEAYRRPHRREFVRSLLVFSLNPESPVRRLILEEALWDEVASLEAWELSRGDAEVDQVPEVVGFRLPPDRRSRVQAAG